MEEVVETGSPLRNSEETYKALNTDIEERLKKLEEREKLINTKYTEQFGKMEQSMTQFNSTKTLLENFIEAWKKNKNSLEAIFFTFSISVVRNNLDLSRLRLYYHYFYPALPL